MAFENVGDKCDQNMKELAERLEKELKLASRNVNSMAWQMIFSDFAKNNDWAHKDKTYNRMSDVDHANACLVDPKTGLWKDMSLDEIGEVVARNRNQGIEPPTIALQCSVGRVESMLGQVVITGISNGYQEFNGIEMLSYDNSTGELTMIGDDGVYSTNETVIRDMKQIESNVRQERWRDGRFDRLEDISLDELCGTDEQIYLDDLYEDVALDELGFDEYSGGRDTDMFISENCSASLDSVEIGDGNGWLDCEIEFEK